MSPASEPGGIQRRMVRAHAKVNLFLAVGARRPDGYHDVTTLIQALELADIVEVGPAPSGTVLVRDVDLGISDEADLAYRAAEAWRDLAGYRGGIEVRVTKRIPAGAGLGGGSSDAAAVLWALAGCPGPDDHVDPAVLSAAATLGADVPFFQGAGTQLMAGRGDEPTAALSTPDLHVVVVDPGVPVPTGAAYAQFDRVLAPPPPGPDDMVRAVREGVARGIAVRLYNNLTQASCSLVPEIRGALRFLEGSEGVLGCAMAGSGSTVFGVFDDAAAAGAAASAATQRGWWSAATATAERGVDVVPAI
jgi:4-diphosphocytidyl-2-C-methyl-D-erythritol kinase